MWQAMSREPGSTGEGNCAWARTRQRGNCKVAATFDARETLGETDGEGDSKAEGEKGEREEQQQQQWQQRA
jgi:hypothetical protein